MENKWSDRALSYSSVSKTQSKEPIMSNIDPKQLTPTLRISTQAATTVRQTPHTNFGAVLTQGLKTFANIIGNVFGAVAPFIPGGSIIQAALTGVQNLAQGATSSSTSGATGSSTGSTGSSPFQQTKELLEMQSRFNMQFLQLQARMQHESRLYMTLSNIMKNRHDTAKNAIRNIV